MMVVCEFNAANTGASTLNISGLGAVTIKTVAGADVTSGDLAGSRYTALVYDGTNFQLLAVTKNYVDQLVFAPVLPNQSGNADKLLGTDGTNAAWTALLKTAVMRFADSTDITKLIALSASGITTGTTRTITMPDKDVTLRKGIDREARTSNTILTNADNGKFIDITSGTFTQTFDAVDDEWFCFYRNSGTGEITIPSSDGVTNWIMYSGESRLFMKDGGALYSAVINPFYKVFTSTGTFTKPPGYSYYGGMLWSGGSSGEKSGSSAKAAGGGGGGSFPFTLPASAVSTTETVTIGAGGVGNWVAGGATSLGSLITVSAPVNAYQGGGVLYSVSNISGDYANGFQGSSGSSVGRDSIYGGASSANDASANSGNSLYGGAAGGSVNGSGTIRTAGTSKLGGNGGAAGDAVSGADGTAPGGGGGATRTGTKSGDGARGECRIWGIV